ncbi:hypothetical protein [Methylibium rhizosphaerae]|uniref:hypothetical protein n=1 Tax=Methylibium rhizosphaerae TaxID=2570323 RepID=UPI00112C895E|nr:hypothetical protein [Methylibium rhizosphaerae]
MAFDHTISQYARHRGCDEKAVRKAIAEGRITAVEIDGRKMIDAAVADIQWAQNTRARADSRKQGQKAAAAAQADDASYAALRTRREAAEAQMAELALAKELGNVIEREPAVSAVFTAFRALRDGGLVIGRKLAANVAAMDDAREVQAAIDAAQRELFDTFSRRTLPALLAQLAGQETAQQPAGEALEAEARETQP